MNKLFTQLVETRHLDESFLHPKYEDLADPFLMPNMEKGPLLDFNEPFLCSG